MRLPYGVQADEADAQLALSFIDADEAVTFNIKSGTDGFESQFEPATGSEMSGFVKGNVKARQRMVAQYAIAGDANLLVVGTDHAAEAVTGFFTKYGDGGVDITPLTGLTKRQGKALLKHLGSPARLYEKTPTADLLDDKPGQPDETELGITYSDIDDYLEGKDVDAAVAEKLEARYRATEHKRRVPVTPFDTWWRGLQARVGPDQPEPGQHRRTRSVEHPPAEQRRRRPRSPRRAAAPTASASQPSTRWPGQQRRRRRAPRTGSASTTVAPITAYDAKIDVVAAPAGAENGLRPDRATGTTMRADDTLTTPTDDQQRAERRARAARAGRRRAR